MREAVVRQQKRQADEALKESVHNLKEQNAEYQALNIEYLRLNEELTESLDRIQNMNSELIVAKNKAEESDKLKSSFLTNMSHEIRTPLNGILGFSVLLKDPELTKNKAERYVEIIEASGQQLLTIISDVLDISKIEAGQILVSLEPVNVNALLYEIYQQFRPQADLKNLNLILNPANLNEDIAANTDGAKVRQVLCNLMSNAIKFTAEGKVEFGIMPNENFLEFYVEDSGIGIGPEDQSVVFIPFRKAVSTTTRLYGGNGLGLSISKAFVEKLGGNITFQSELNKGSTFVFTIPYIKNIENQPQPMTEAESTPYQNWNEKTILIAEDEEFNFSYIEEILEPMHVATMHAWNGLEAVELAKKYPGISLVLMDIRMPEMDGLAATKLIKALRPQLPVIAQTAYATKEDKENAQKSGCDYYLSKPIARDQLVEVIDKYIG